MSENNCCNCFRQKPGNTIKIAINLQQLFVDTSLFREEKEKEALLYGESRLEGNKMVSQKVVIKNPTGLHLRPAGILCKEAMQFKSLITFQFRENTANAKSVLSVLGACVKSGDEIELFCEGEDEQEALSTLVQAVESGLGE